MEKNSSYAIKISVRYIISAVVAFFLYLSVMVIMTGMFTEAIGYTAYDDATGKVLYDHYNADGEDTKKAEYEAQGIKISTVVIRSNVAEKPQFWADLICQVIAGGVALAFVHNTLWHLGDSDENLVSFSHREEDKLRGFKIGGLAVIPLCIAFLLAVLGQAKILPSGVIAIYRFMNYQVFALGNLFFGHSLTDYSAISWGNLLGSASLMVILPIISGVCYILGYKHITFADKLIYKKKKETK